MKMILTAFTTLIMAFSSYGNDLINVSVEVKQIVIDNIGNGQSSVQFKTVCKLNDVIEFADVRNSNIQNSVARKIKGNCNINYLDKNEVVSLYVGSGVYLDENRENVYSLTASVTVAGVHTTVWGSSNREIPEIFNLVLETPEVALPSKPNRKESLRVFYKFLK